MSSIVSDTEHHIGCRHQSFCQTVHEQCTVLLSEKQLFYMCHPGQAPQELLESNLSVNKLLDQAHDESSTDSGSKICNGATPPAMKPSTLNIGSDLEGLPQARVMDTLPQGSTGIPCFPLPGRLSGSKSSNSSGRSSDAHSQGSGPSRPASDSTNSIGNTSQVTESSDSYVVVHNSEHDFSRGMLNQVKDNIHKHIDQICSSLQDELGYADSAYYRKIWLCYETLFYDDLMPHLVELYESVFRSVSSGLQELLPLMTVDELDIGGSIILHMLRGRHPSLDAPAEFRN